MRCLFFLFLFMTAVLPAHPQTADSLQARLDEVVERNLPQGSSVGIMVYDLTDNRPLYLRDADKLCRPASTMKLMTAVTALDMPGADRPFSTELWYKGHIERDTLHGDLYVVGGFDPEFCLEDMDSLVEALCRLPFHTLQGKVYGDLSVKDSLYWGAGWLWDDNPSAFQPYLSPLMLEKGTVKVTAYPADIRGVPARLVCFPPSSYYSVDNNTRTRTPRAGGFKLTRDWMDNGNRLLATGNIAGAQALTVNLFRSERMFMHVLVERMRGRGLQVDSVYAFRKLEADSTAVRVAVQHTPMQAVLDQMMKESDNLNAEAVLWSIGRQVSDGRPVTAKDGLGQVKALIAKLGLDARDYRLADGCGLSHYDYLSPRLLVETLKCAYARTSIFGKLYKSLPVSGMDGTLKYRLGRGTPCYRRVHAKTGSYTGVNCLAGYLQTAGGHWLAFAIMNQNVMSGRASRILQDSICLQLVGVH